MEGGVLKSKECGPPISLKKYNTFGLSLDISFTEAKNGKFVEGVTENLYEFLRRAEDKKNIIDCKSLPLVTGSNVYFWGMNVSGDDPNIITSMDMSCMINSYLLKHGGFEKDPKIDEFYEKYFPFITSCRKVSRNVFKHPGVRIPFEENILKDSSETYEKFLQFLKNDADSVDYNAKKSGGRNWYI